MVLLQTERLDLIPLTSKQLQQYLDYPDQLEQELNIPLSRSIISDNVQRAIKMKLEKMTRIDKAQMVWITYWLLVIRNIPFGAGLAGFKGFPNQKGEVEIGYGIDPVCQKQGYMTEAVQRMIHWAFEEQTCLSVVARDVKRWNLASRRILAKVGMTVYEESEETLSYMIERKKIKRFLSPINDRPTRGSG